MPRLLKIAGSLLVAAQMIGLSGAAFAQSASLDDILAKAATVGSSRVDLQACKLEYSIVSPK